MPGIVTCMVVYSCTEYWVWLTLYGEISSRRHNLSNLGNFCLVTSLTFLLSNPSASSNQEFSRTKERMMWPILVGFYLAFRIFIWVLLRTVRLDVVARTKSIDIFDNFKVLCNMALILMWWHVLGMFYECSLSILELHANPNQPIPFSTFRPIF